MRRNLVFGLSISVLAIVGMSILMSAATGDARIADAAMKGDRDSVKAMLKQAQDVNAAQGDGMTALHWAAIKGDAEMADLLIYAGANLKATTRLGGYTPLYMAAKSGSATVVARLLKAGADPKAAALDGITPLMMAATAGEPETIKELLEGGADPNAKESEHGQTALSFAAAFNRAEAIKVLATHGANLNSASTVIVPAAPQRGFAATPAPAAGTPAPAGAAPAAAANGGGGRGGRGAGGAAPAAANAQGGAPAAAGGAAAANGGAAQAAAAAAGADGAARGGGNNKGGLTPLMYAARQGSEAAAIALLDSGADVNAVSGDKSTALLFATINAHFNLAKIFVDRGANPNLASVDGATPLYGVANTQWARHSGYPQPTPKYESVSYMDLMKALLDKGADPNARLAKELWYSEYNFSLESASAAGTTAFWKCAEVGDVDGMKLLVSRGADPNIASRDGVTPLLMASGAGTHGNDDITAPPGRMAALRYLVEDLHADVNAADTGGGGGFGGRGGGVTALHNAASRGDNEMILYLVSKGARPDAVANNGSTVADMANGPRQRIQPYPDTVALLEMLGSKNNHKCVSC